MTETITDRIGQAIGDPGSVTARRLDGGSNRLESVTRWSTRAVLWTLAQESDTDEMSALIRSALDHADVRRRPTNVLADAVGVVLAAYFTEAAER